MQNQNKCFSHVYWHLEIRQHSSNSTWQQTSLGASEVRRRRLREKLLSKTAFHQYARDKLLIIFIMQESTSESFSSLCLAVSIKTICRTTSFKVFAPEFLFEYNCIIFTSFSLLIESRAHQASKMWLSHEIVDINYFCKKLHLRCLMGSWIYVCGFQIWLLNQLSKSLTAFPVQMVWS